MGVLRNSVPSALWADIRKLLLARERLGEGAAKQALDERVHAYRSIANQPLAIRSLNPLKARDVDLLVSDLAAALHLEGGDEAEKPGPSAETILGRMSALACPL